MAERMVDRICPILVLGLRRNVQPRLILGCYANAVGSHRSLVNSFRSGELDWSVARYVQVKEAKKTLMSARNSSCGMRRREGGGCVPGGGEGIYRQ